MSKVIINDIELDFDVFDADTMEKYENALKVVQEEVAKIQSEQNLRASDSIKRQCDTIFDFFDDVFGEGTSDNIFEGKYNLMQCLDAFEACVNSVDEQRKAFSEKYKDKFTVVQNRAQRRSAARHEHN